MTSYHSGYMCNLIAFNRGRCNKSEECNRGQSVTGIKCITAYGGNAASDGYRGKGVKCKRTATDCYDAIRYSYRAGMCQRTPHHR